MGEEKKFRKFTLPVLILSGIIISALVYSCITATRSIPVSSEKYSFGGYQVPESQNKIKVPFAVIIVEPYYKETIERELRPVTKSFSSNIGIGLEQILIAKGANTKGPYGSLEEITYPDRKGANLTLTETVFILIEDKEQSGMVRERFQGSDPYQPDTFEVETRRMSVEIWLTYEMREPLTAEKMWIKKLELGSFEEEYQMGKEVRWEQRDPWAPGKWVYGKRSFNTKKDVFAGILSKVYPQIMQAAWTYIHPEEMQILDKKADEIRSRKVYEYAPR